MAKTENITAKFSAKVPEAIINECHSKKFYKKGSHGNAPLYCMGVI
jgi:hypothetical protein